MINSAITEQVYTQVKTALTEKLIGRGYQRVLEQQNDKVFDSRYIIWSNNRDALRLTWDGKEGIFLLEVTQSLPISGITAWSELVEVSFDADRHTVSYADGVMQQLLDSLE